MNSNLERLNISNHFAIYLLSSLAIGSLLIEQARLSSRAGVQADILGSVLVQQSIMAVLILGLLTPAYTWTRQRWPYALACILFAGYSGSRLAAAFNATLRLVPTLESEGIPISDYRGTFYVLALSAAFSYLLMILLLRRSYGKLVSRRTVGIVSGIAFFHEGNKRTALVAARSFLKMNGYEIDISARGLENVLDQAGIGQARLSKVTEIIRGLVRNV